MKTIDIKGKAYIEVNERIKEFRNNENYKGYTLTSDIVSIENGVCIIKAEIRNPEGILLATGYAYEKEGSSFINKTSYIENCYYRETEILTNKGWKYVDQLEINDNIGQVDLETNELTFSKPIKIIKQENQNFIKLYDNINEQIVTPKHFVIIDNKKIYAEDVKEKVNKFKNDFYYESNLYSHLSLEFIKILQWVIADGYIDYTHNHIKFGFTKIRKIDRLKKLLNSEKIEYTESFNEKKQIFRLNIKKADIILKYLPQKTLVFDLCMGLSIEQGKAFIEEISLTDGYIHKDGIYLRQTDKEYFDNLNLLAIRCGYEILSPNYNNRVKDNCFANAKGIYGARYKKGGRRLKTKIEKLNIIDTAYCVKMPKGTLITRINNKITVSSNCETSAWGRALGNLGIGIDTSIATADEVLNAVKQQKADKWLNYEDFKQIIECGNTTEEQIAHIIKEDGFKLSNFAKTAVRHYCETGEIDKNLFFKQPK